MALHICTWHAVCDVANWQGCAAGGRKQCVESYSHWRAMLAQVCTPVADMPDHARQLGLGVQQSHAARALNCSQEPLFPHKQNLVLGALSMLVAYDTFLAWQSQSMPRFLIQQLLNN